MSDTSQLKEQAAAAILERIPTEATLGNAAKVLQLAEAFAWLARPGQGHSGTRSS
jgi:hypothetical protein